MPAPSGNRVQPVDSKLRFTDRTRAYAQYRPGYPPEVIRLLRAKCGLTPESIVADIGSGTGLLTQLFLENGNVVYGVEPNQAMRDAGQSFLKGYPNFHSVAGAAESTTLPDAAADLLVVGQAFHWFDVERTKTEFCRILRPQGWVAIVWNERKTESTPFLQEYESLLRRYGTDYGHVAAKYLGGRNLKEFSAPNPLHRKSFPNEQSFDFEGLRGRLMSSSYAPQAGHASHEPMLAELKRIFNAHKESGRVRFEYETQVFYGRLQPADAAPAGRQ